MSEIIDDNSCAGQNPLYGERVISVVGGRDIEVVPTVEGLNTKYVVNYEKDVDPYLIESYTQAEAEVGENIAALTATIRLMPGTDDLILVDSVPDIDPVPINEDFTLNYTDVTSNAPGKKNLQQLNVTDTDGEIFNLIIGPTFKHRFFMLFSILQEPSEINIEDSVGYLGLSLFENYGGLNEYIIPAIGLKQYLHWYYPVGTQNIEGALLSDLSFALVKEPNINITNSHGLTVEYVHYRSAANFAPQTLNIGLY